jgi:carbonic anhydrase
MRLFEAIIDANHRAVAGDASAGLHPAEFADALPVVALTCIDPRLNAFFPNALALPAEEFIWLRNAGNIITSTLSSTLRSLALACAVKGGREIAIIGHSDCQVAKTTTTVLLDKLKALGVDRSRLPDNLNEFFGTFGSERQNIIKACDFVRNSPLIGPNIPVHGLLLDVETGKLEWIVNGYETLLTHAAAGLPGEAASPKFGGHLESLGAFKDFAMGEMKFPEMKIGELAAQAEDWQSKMTGEIGAKAQSEIQQARPVAQAAESVAGQLAAFAEKNWPKPPPIRVPSPGVTKSPLPPIRPGKAPLPPPIRPGADWRRK